MIKKVEGPLQNREVAFSTVTPVERKKAVAFFCHPSSKQKLKLEKETPIKGEKRRQANPVKGKARGGPMVHKYNS